MPILFKRPFILRLGVPKNVNIQNIFCKSAQSTQYNVRSSWGFFFFKNPIITSYEYICTHYTVNVFWLFLVVPIYFHAIAKKKKKKKKKMANFQIFKKLLIFCNELCELWTIIIWYVLFWWRFMTHWWNVRLFALDHV